MSDGSQPEGYIGSHSTISTDCRVGAEIRPDLLAKFTDIKATWSFFLLPLRRDAMIYGA